MAVIGVELPQDTLVLTKGRDFKWTFTNLSAAGKPIPFPAGDLYFEITTSPSPTTWPFTIVGNTATIKVESTAVDLIPDKAKWQLVFLPDAEAAGGDALARGVVKVQQ